MTAPDPLAVFYTQPFDVERYLGDGPEGPALEPAVSLFGRIVFASKLSTDPQGDETVLSFARISMPADTATIPVGSYVTVRGHRRRVIAESLHRGGFKGSPDYYSIELD